MHCQAQCTEGKFWSPAIPKSRSRSKCLRHQELQRVLLHPLWRSILLHEGIPCSSHIQVMSNTLHFHQLQSAWAPLGWSGQVLSSTAQVLKKKNIAITRIPPKQVIPVAPTKRKFSIVLIATLRYTEYFDEMKFVHSRSESPLCFESFVATGLTVCIKGKLNRKKNLILVASTQVLDKGEAQVDCPACHFQNTCPNFRVARSLLSH